MNFLLPLTLHGCEFPWLPWHEKQSSQPWPSTKMLGAGRKVCLATWHGPFLLPFREAGATLAVVTPGRFSIPVWLTCTSKTPLSKSKGHLPKAAMRWEVLAFPMLHCLIQTSSVVQEPQDSSSPASESLLASWTASFGGQWALDPMREPVWPLQLEVTRKTGQMRASNTARKLSSSTDKKFSLSQIVCVNWICFNLKHHSKYVVLLWLT